MQGLEGSTQIFVAMVLYIAVVIGIGVYYTKRASESSANYLIGGRSLNPWVTALGAEASDMSGWLLMASRSSLLVWVKRCYLDGNRAFNRNLFKLVICCKKIKNILSGGRKFNYYS